MGIADKAKNAPQDVAGKVKETVGDATDDHELKAEGKADQAKASAKATGEDVKDVLKG